MAERIELGEAFPLDWPSGYPRTRSPSRAVYKATIGKARDQVLHELRLMGIGDWNVIISSSVPVSNRTGQMLAMKAEPGDRGVAVYFRKKDKPYVFSCDKWDRVADNLRAIALTIEAMRGLERWGCSEMLERAFQGFQALPPPQMKSEKRKWWDVLDCRRDSSLEVVERQYKVRAMSAHPDRGGSNEKMAELNQAIEEARGEAR